MGGGVSRPGSCKNRKRIPVLLFKHTHKKKSCYEYCPRLLECCVDIYKYVVRMSTVAECSHPLGGGGGGANFGLFLSQPLDPTLMTGSTVCHAHFPRLGRRLSVGLTRQSQTIGSRAACQSQTIGSRAACKFSHARCARAQRVPSGCGSFSRFQFTRQLYSALLVTALVSVLYIGYKMCLT